MALFGSGKNQRPSTQYEQRRSNSRQQERYKNERDLREQRVKSRNRLIGSVILVLAAIVILPLILKTGDDSSTRNSSNAPLIAPGPSAGKDGLVVESSPGVETPKDSELLDEQSSESEANLSIAEGGKLPSDDNNSPMAIGNEPLVEGEDEAARDDNSGVSIAESTAEQNELDEAAARERAEQEAAAKEKAKQQARADAKKAEQQKQQQKAATTEPKRTDDGSKALAILEGRSTQETSSSTSSTASTSGEFSLQVASYSSANDARTQRDRLRSSGVSNAYVQSATVNGNQVFRLRVGPFSTKEAAQATQTRLRALNFSDSYVTGR